MFVVCGSVMVFEVFCLLKRAFRRALQRVLACFCLISGVKFQRTYSWNCCFTCILYIFCYKKQVFCVITSGIWFCLVGSRFFVVYIVGSLRGTPCIPLLFWYTLGHWILLIFVLLVYLYSFDRFFGFDKVCKMADLSCTTLKWWKRPRKIQPGDLLVFGNQYFLALWETLAFEEQYTHLSTTQVELLYAGFLSLPTLQLFHWMVETYYTTYKSVVRLFFAHDIEKLLEREAKVKTVVPIALPSKTRLPHMFSLAPVGQTLIVFPDIRTMHNMVDDAFMLHPAVACLLSIQTQHQKDVHRWEIKKWIKSVVLCTYAEIFQDFSDLKKIIFVDPHKRYYAHQQDPRYKVGDVIDQMKALYWAEVEIVGV